MEEMKIIESKEDAMVEQERQIKATVCTALLFGLAFVLVSRSELTRIFQKLTIYRKKGSLQRSSRLSKISAPWPRRTLSSNRSCETSARTWLR